MRKFAVVLLICLFLSVCFFPVENYSKCENNNEQDHVVNISMVGDILLDGRIRSFIDKNGVNYPWQKVQNYFKQSDLVVGNLETSITHSGQKWQDKQFNFRSDPEMLKGIKDSGIEVLTLANNHVLDYGYSGLIDTLDNLEKYDIKYTGAGRNKKQAIKGVIVEKNKVKIGILSFSRVIPHVDWYATSKRCGVVSAYNPYIEEVLQRVREMKKQTDIVILSLHWGVEKSSKPRNQEINLARKAIDNGADIIMGHHPHVLQGIEIYKGKPIFYSLGNFVFNSWSELNSQTIIAQVKIKDKQIQDINFVPCKIVNCRPEPLIGKSKEKLINYMRSISKSFNTHLDKNGYILFNKS